MSTKRRTLGRVAQASVRAGALRLTPRLAAPANTVFVDSEQSVIAAAAQAIGESVASCAITLGPRRYNRKPVVQLFDERAATAGFMKVGADAATSAMVATEAATLDRLAPDTSLLRVPRVLWHATWRDQTVACVSPVRAQGSIVPADRARLIAVADAVVNSLGGRHLAPLSDSGPVTRLRELAMKQVAQPEIDIVHRAEQIAGQSAVVLGGWHGDFSPWNMISDDTSTALIDWEFSQDQMPVGADLLHNEVMVATHLHSEPVIKPLEQLRTYGNNIPALHALGIAADKHQAHLVLYLFELMRRDIELQATGRVPTGFGKPALSVAASILDQMSGDDSS